MFRTRYIRSLMILAAAAVVACTDDPVDPADSAGTDPMEGAEPASLTINFSIADLGVDVSTRAGEGDSGASDNTETPTVDPTTPTTGTYGNTLSDTDVFDKADILAPEYVWPDPAIWYTTDIEQKKKNYRIAEGALIDGSMMTCLTVILVHRHSNRIVGIRRIPDPDCPNHDVRYLNSEQESSTGHTYPPQKEPEITNVKKNCILMKNKQGGFDLAPIAVNEDGNNATDNKGNITGLIGTHACVTFEYDFPIHKVDQNMLKEYAENAYPNDATEQEKFISDNQKYLGQSAEKLLRGEYSLFVIANYDHKVTTSEKEGTTEATLNVDKTLEKLTNDFHQPQYMAEGIPNFNPTYSFLYNLRFLMNRTLDANDVIVDNPLTDKDGNKIELLDKNGNQREDKNGNKLYRKPYIRPAVHQTLTAAKEIYLEAGKNVIDVELTRIASRTRVEVKNYGDKPLKIHSLEFSPNYTQSTTYLFRRNKNDRDYSELATNSGLVPSSPGLHNDHDGKGAPAVQYTGIYNYFGSKTYGAIVPFVNNMDSDDDDNVNDYVGVPAGGKRCIFDALMYESSLKYKDESHTDPDNPSVLADPDSFYYTIDVSYPEIKDYRTTDPNKIDMDANPTIDPNGGFDFALEGDTKYLTFSNVAEFIQKVGEYSSTGSSEGTSEGTEGGTAGTSEGGTEETSEKNYYFLIQGLKTGRFLQETVNEDILAQKLQDNKISFDRGDIKTFLWKVNIVNSGDKQLCELISLNSVSDKDNPNPRYIPNVPPQAKIWKTTDNATPHQHILEVLKESDNAVLFGTEVNPPVSNHNMYYLNVFAEDINLGGWYLEYKDDEDRNSKFRLYPVKAIPMYTGTPRMQKKVELTAFSDRTGYVEKVTEIQRNDFIRILVEVSYNTEKKDFMFQVNSWKTGGGEVSFH